MALFENQDTSVLAFKTDLCHNMSLVLRKPAFGISDQVRHNPGTAATEDD